MPARRSTPKPPSRSKSGSGLPAGLSRESVSRFLREGARAWLQDPNIVGISVGEKESGGEGTGITAVKFDVIGKLADRADIIRAGTRPIPETIEIDGISLPTDVEEGWPEAHALAPSNAKARHDPVSGGISIGVRTDTGTLGALLWHRPSGQPVALSNWHVLANNGEGAPTFQPGPGDSAGQSHPLGTLRDQVLDIDLDAAISTVRDRGVRAEIAGLGVPVSGVAAPQLDMPVVKAGKETGITFGRISILEMQLTYRVFGLPERHAIMVCVIKPDPQRPASSALSTHGDSGSCWMLVGDDGRPTGTMVGLHVAGDAVRKLAYACYADKVFERFGLEPLGARTLAAPPPLPPVASGTGPALHRVMARDGLLIRSGPGREFPDKGGLAFGTDVSVLSRHGDWLAVDLQGDGRADGFMHGSLLRPIDPS